MVARPLRSFLFLIVLILGSGFGVARSEAASLEDILLQKGILTQEELAEIKAEQGKNGEEQTPEKAPPQKDESPIKVEYERPGFSISTRDGQWETNIKWRVQMRASYPFNQDPRLPEDFEGIDEASFNIQRARIKIGGHGYKPWLKYYFEYDWPSSRLLDWRGMVERFEWLQLQVGQWKINYNRERVDSSGKQQFVERSIVNREFTIDRQQGIMLHGHLFPQTLADMWYHAGVFTGMGRGENSNDDDNLMWMGRLQWNFLGRDLKFSQSDVEFHRKPTGSVAFAAVTNKSRCTRWSSSGCGSLDGFPSPDAAEPGQFRVNQMVEETAFKYRGFSLQHEYHWKQVEDRVNQTKTQLTGSYAQAGYFPHYVLPAIPKPLEIAFRYAFVDPDRSRSNDLRQEFTLAFNWFFSGHNNKLTLDVSHLEASHEALEQPGSELFNDQRVRLQWDVTF